MTSIDYKKLIVIFTVSCFVGLISAYNFYEFIKADGFNRATEFIGYSSFHNYNHVAVQYSYLIGAITTLTLLLAGLVFINRIDWPPIFDKLLGFNILCVTLVGITLQFNSNKPLWILWVDVGVVLLATEWLLHTFSSRIRFVNPSSLLFFFFGLLTLLSPIILMRISAATGWIDGNKFIPLPWIHWSFLLITEVIALIIVSHAWIKNQSLELLLKNVSNIIFIPILIFIITAHARGVFDLGGDNFHSGENLAPLTLSLQGYLPWKDFLFFHGVWEDLLVRLIPAMIWERSLRGGLVGQDLIFTPIFWIGMYYAFLIIFDNQRIKALLAFFVCLTISSHPFKFILYPIIICVYFLGFQKNSVFYWITFTLLGIIQIILAPEFGAIALGMAISVMIFSIIHLQLPLKSSIATLPLTTCALTAFVSLAIFGISLHYFGLLDGFIVSSTQFPKDFMISVGIPLMEFPNRAWLISIPLIFAFGSLTLWLTQYREKKISPITWVILGIGLGTFIYYPKFTGRADGHIYHILQAIKPGIAILLVFLGSLILKSSKVSNLRSSNTPWLVALFLVLVLGKAGLSTQNWIEYSATQLFSTKERFISKSGSQEPQFIAPGIEATGLQSFGKISILRNFFANNLDSADSIFDFSDSPAIYHALLPLKPASRFIYASLLGNPKSMDLALLDLMNSKPKYVIYRAAGGFNGLDGVSNEVRYYKISSYINENYQFDRQIADAVIFIRKGIAPISNEKQRDQDSLFQNCNLGYAPNFLINKSSISPINAIKNDESKAMLSISGWIANKNSQNKNTFSLNTEPGKQTPLPPSMRRPDVNILLNTPQLAEVEFHKNIYIPRTAEHSKAMDLIYYSGSQRYQKPLGLGKWETANFSSNIDRIETYYALPLYSGDKTAPRFLSIEFSGDSEQIIYIGSIDLNGIPKKISFHKLKNHSTLLLPIGGCNNWQSIYTSNPVIYSPTHLNIKNAKYF
jgi:hypothetical protein